MPSGIKYRCLYHSLAAHMIFVKAIDTSVVVPNLVNMFAVGVVTPNVAESFVGANVTET